jgi:lysophospholipase L1-like esterase
MSRVPRTIAATLALMVSLLVFPSAIPWMVGFWLLVHSWLVWRGRVGWEPLLACLLILMAKGLCWSPGLIVFSMAAVAVGSLRLGMASGNGNQRLRGRVAIAVIWIAWGLLTIDWYRGTQPRDGYVLDPSRPVVCLGDSLTAFGYPQQLADRLAVPVVDFGQDGITAADGVKRVPAILASRPQVVVVELGGHDFLKGRSRADTKATLERIIRDCRSRGTQVVLFEIPRGFIFDKYWGLERQIAREHDLQLIPDTAIRKLVLFSPAAPPGLWLGRSHHLSDDGLHPNARGNVALADTVSSTLQRIYGSHILRGQDM